MIQIQQLKLSITHTREDLEAKVLKTLKIHKEQLLELRIAKQSIDARKKQDIHYVYTIEADTTDDKKIADRLHKIKSAVRKKPSTIFQLRAVPNLRAGPSSQEAARPAYFAPICLLLTATPR